MYIAADIRRYFLVDDLMGLFLHVSSGYLHVHRGQLVQPALRPVEFNDVVAMAHEFWACEIIAALAHPRGFFTPPYVALKRAPRTPGLYQLHGLVLSPDPIAIYPPHTPPEAWRWLEIQACIDLSFHQVLRRQHARVILPASLVEEGEMLDEFTLIERTSDTATLRWSRVIAGAD